jgi:hypothetical protein
LATTKKKKQKKLKGTEFGVKNNKRERPAILINSVAHLVLPKAAAGLS